jgi:hypothetical protein
MKRVSIVLALLVLATMSLATDIDVKSKVDRSQPIANPPFTNAIKSWQLNPAQACTTISKDIAGFGGFSMQLWDSVKTSGDTIIINMKYQIANKDTVAAFSCEDLADSTVFSADTLIGVAAAASKKGYSKVVDFSEKVPRCGYIRYIIKNNGPDTCRAVRIFPQYNLSTP